MTVFEAIVVLGIENTRFSADDLKSAYRKQVKQYHPDIVGAVGAEKIKQINEANNVCKEFLKYYPGSVGGINDMVEQDIYDEAEDFYRQFKERFVKNMMNNPYFRQRQR